MVTRRTQRDRRAAQNATRAVERAVDTDHGAYEPPPRDECAEKQWAMAADDANTMEIQVNVWRLRGRLADFVINVRVVTADGWTSVERFDCCHGHCHLHPDGSAPTRTILRLDTIDDIDRAFRTALSFAEERVRILRERGI